MACSENISKAPDRLIRWWHNPHWLENSNYSSQWDTVGRYKQSSYLAPFILPLYHPSKQIMCITGILVRDRKYWVFTVVVWVWASNFHSADLPWSKSYICDHKHMCVSLQSFYLWTYFGRKIHFFGWPPFRALNAWAASRRWVFCRSKATTLRLP